MREILAVIAAATSAVLVATPALASGDPPRLPATPVQVPPPQAHHHGPIDLRRVVPGVLNTGNWAGYDVQAAAGKHFVGITGSFTVPSLDCADTKMGTSNDAFTDSWVGLEAFGTSNAGLPQDGIESFCTGKSGQFGGSGGYLAWYFVCCSSAHPSLGVFDIPGGITAGQELWFRTLWIPSLSEFQFVVWYGPNASDHITKYVPCWTGLNCADTTAEVITEDPGSGPPADPMVEWPPSYQACLPCIAFPQILYDVGTAQAGDCPPGQTVCGVQLSDGTTGTLFSKTGDWTSNIIGLFNGAPEVAVGDTSAGDGYPDALQSAGAGDSYFGTSCEVRLVGGGIPACPYHNY